MLGGTRRGDDLGPVGGRRTSDDRQTAAALDALDSSIGLTSADKPAQIEETETPLLRFGDPMVAAGKAIPLLTRMDRVDKCGLETGSVYGTAVAMPQIARSAGWPGTFIALSVRSYTFLIINILLQAFILSMIGTEQYIMYPFGGQMHLCDFGSNIARCHQDPEAPDCTGPGGTPLSYPRLYSYDVWNMRLYVRDSLKAIFPDKADEIEKKIDPGEYGIENYWCRAACIFIFMTAVVGDLRGTLSLGYVLWVIPTGDDPWITYECPGTDKKKNQAKEVFGMSEIDFVKFRVSAMPMGWKVWNFFLCFVPKFGLWFALAGSGVHYLMETADIVDMVVNAMALTFVLDIDELLYARLSTTVTRSIMERLQNYTPEDLGAEDELSDSEVLVRYTQEELGSHRWSKLRLIVPYRLLFILLTQAMFMIIYYYNNCTHDKRGGLVSQAMALPDVASINPLKLMFGIKPLEEKEFFWTMPDN